MTQIRALFSRRRLSRELHTPVELEKRLELVAREFRQAARSLRRSPGFALASIGVLALGIGAATAAYGVARAVLLQPLPYPEDERLFTVYEADATGARRPPSWPTVREWRADTRAFAGLAYVRGESISVRGGEGTMLLLAAWPTAEFFRTLDVEPALGRVFGDEEAMIGERVAVLSWHLWQDQFASDPNVIGQSLTTDVGPFTVIGVMPAGVRYPAWADLWLPQGALTAEGLEAIQRRDLHVDAVTVGRLAPAASAESAAAELKAFNERAAQTHPDARGWTLIDMRSLRSEVVGSSANRVGLLGGATVLLLLLACVNVAGLLLARAAARGRELSVRAALGASRTRLAGQLLTESALLAAGGGLLGVFVGNTLLRVLATRAGSALPRLDTAHIDGAALLVALGVSGLTLLVFGVAPARQVGRTSPMAGLRGSQGTVSTPGVERVRRTLVVAEVALAVALVVGATATARALLRLSSADLGFATDGLAVVRVLPPAQRYGSAEAAVALYDRLAVEIARADGVRQVALINHLPLSGTSMPTELHTVRVPGPNERPSALYRAISANWFDLMQLQLTRGRPLLDEEVRTRAPVVVVNQALASREWPGRDPVGESITIRKVAQGRADFGEEMTLTVVGVASDTRSFGPEQVEPPVVYVPYTLAIWPNIFVVARGEEFAPVLAVRNAIQSVDPAIPVAGPGFSNRVRPIEDYAANLLAARRLSTTLLTGFALAAILLAAVGLFGVIAYLVEQRRREFGVRVAIGASRGTIVTLVLRRAVALTLVGLAVGSGVAWALGRVFRDSQPDLAAPVYSPFVVATVVFFVATLAASALPALRASRVAPARILREDG